MAEVFVQHRQHHVDDDHGEQQQQGQLHRRFLEFLCRTGELQRHFGRHHFPCGVERGRQRGVERSARREVERQRDRGLLAVVMHRDRAHSGLHLRHRIEPGERPRRRLERQLADHRRAQLGLRQHLDADVVLVAGAVDFANAAPAQRVVQGLLHLLCGDAETRRLDRIEADPEFGIAQLQVAADVDDQRHRVEAFFDGVRHRLEHFEIARGQRQLVVGAGGQGADVDRRRILQGDADAGKLAGGRTQLVDDVVGAGTGVARGQADHQAADVAPGDAAAGLSRRGHQAFDRRMRLHDGGQLLLALAQVIEGDAFRITHAGEDHPGVDARDETLPDLAGEPDHRPQHCGRQQQHRAAMPHRRTQGVAIEITESVEAGVEQARQRIVDRLVREAACAQHRRQRQRHHPGEQHGDADADRELLEQPADHVAHEQDGQEYGGERDRHRKHGEADLLCTVERCLHAGLAHVQMTRDVLDHHHRVVDDEADRQRDRHQREVVEAVARQMHEGEGAEQRTRQHQCRDQGGTQVVQEGEDDEDHQPQREEQGEVDLVQRILDEARVVVMDVQPHAIG